MSKCKIMKQSHVENYLVKMLTTNLLSMSRICGKIDLPKLCDFGKFVGSLKTVTKFCLRHNRMFYFHKAWDSLNVNQDSNMGPISQQFSHCLILQTSFFPKEKVPSSTTHSDLLRRSLCAGFFCNVARKASSGRGFHTMEGHGTTVFIHPSSAVSWIGTSFI